VTGKQAHGRDAGNGIDALAAAPASWLIFMPAGAALAQRHSKVEGITSRR